MLEELPFLGLSDKECKLLSVLFEHGRSTAHQLAKRTGFSRATVYFLADTLEKQGLIDQFHSKGKLYISPPRSADVFTSMIEREKLAVEEKMRRAKRLSEALQPLLENRTQFAPRTIFVEGKKKVLSLMYDNIEQWRTSLKEYDFTWWGYEDPGFIDHYKEWFEWYWKRSAPREKHGEKVRIFSDTPFAPKLKGMFRDTILRPPPVGHNFTSTIWVLGNFVIVFMSRKTPHYAIQIYEPLLARNLAGIFRLLWERV